MSAAEIAKVLGRASHSNGQWSCLCPAHDDKDPSLSITEGADGTLLWKCHAGCEQLAVRDALRAKGLLNGTDTTTTGKMIGAVYDYVDRDGVLAHQVVRFLPKDFRQRRPGTDGAWIWNLQGVTPIPYKLPRVLEAIKDGKTIYMCEGEKDCDNLARIGLVATTNAGGAGKWKATHAQWLKGADVVVLPDNDQVGRDHAAEVARSLAGIAKRVRICNLPELPEKGDVSDFLGDDASADTLLTAIDEILKAPEVSNDESHWPPPVLFDAMETPEIRAGLLPDPIGAYVAALAEHTETPPALGVLVALAVVSAATRGRVQVEISSAHRETVNLYLLAVLASGNRKSSVFSGLSEPLISWEREQAEILGPHVAQQRSRRKSAESVIEHRRRRLHKLADDDRRREIEDIAREEADLPSVPVLPKLFANDATPESLAAAIAEQQGVFAVLSDEGGILDVLSGLYTNGHANIDVLLKGWDRGPCRIRRRDREVDINPSLTLGLAVQPATLINLAGKRAFLGRGLVERFLYVLPVSSLGHRTHDRPPPDRGVVSAYRAAVEKILREDRPVVLTLSESAAADLRQFRQETEGMFRPGGRLAEFPGWGSKLPGQLARIAALFHLVERPQATEIGPETMARALELGDLLVDHAIAALVQMGLDEATGDAQRCWRWIAGRAGFRRGDLTLAMRHVMNAKRITAALKVLAGRNLIDSEAGEATPGTRERLFRVNPRTEGAQ